jgi:hypothetical protein
MEKFNGITEGPLSISRNDDEETLVLSFTGKSILRDPTELLQPNLFLVLDEVEETGKTLVLDFTELSYMNSSTFTPLVKTLEKARRGTCRVRVLYDESQKWQSVSFAALTIFNTTDGRVQVEGKKA